MKPNYTETGTAISGYSEDGPFHCEDCIHKPSPTTPLCMHPVIMVDPALKSKKQKGSGYVKINLEKGCCRYVRPPKDKEVPSLLRIK